MLTGVLLTITAATSVGIVYEDDDITIQDSASHKQIVREGDGNVRRRMSHSAYPVQLHVVGNAVRVDSPQAQVLPIYTHNGTFYLIMRLNKGINWLNGLPKGRYFINNRIVVIK